MTDFHFIRPWWLLALALIALIAYLLKHLRVSQSGWQQVIPNHLVTTLLSGEHQQQKNTTLLPCLIAFITIIALAGPTWEKLPQPVYNVKKGAVVILDLSTSMYATDIAPNRLTRARFKVLDLLDKLNEGDVGLIAYAGDSFVISPLTEDTNNIKLLLPELAPNIMPVQGSNPLLALTMADEMLTNAGHAQGDIFWLTDEADRYDVEEVSSFFGKIKHHINILGVGTKNGAPIKLPNGQLLKDNSGSIVVPHLTVSALESLARKGRGTYKTLTNSASDINTLLASSVHSSLNDSEKRENSFNLSDNTLGNKANSENNSTSSDTYKDMGPYFLLLIIPLLLPYFRRGSLMALLPCCLWFTQVPESYAQETFVNDNKATNGVVNNEDESNSNESPNGWKNLWQTQNQQAQQHYQNENYQKAAEQFNDNMWQGSAHYKNGNFAEALSAFEQEDSAQALYNQGNSLAKLGQLEEAISAYEQALIKNPELTEALANKNVVEKIIEQQKQQQQNQEGEQSGEQSDQDSEQSKSDEQESSDQEKGSEKNKDAEQESSEKQSDESDSENAEENSDKNSSDNKDSEQSSNDNSQDSDQKQDQSESNDDPKNSEKGDDEKQSQPSEEELEQYKQALEDELNKQQEQAEQDKENAAQQPIEQNSIDEEESNDEVAQVAALSAEEQAEQENEQHKQQLFKKLTDNPALLLRNKMRLEYQKRRQDRQRSGVNKQW